jgi:hypothetical protein
LALLSAVELGCGAGVGHGIQGRIAPLTSSGQPAPDTPVADTEDTGHLGNRRTFLDSLDGALAPPFEFLGASVRSHAGSRQKSGHCDKISSANHQTNMRTLAA